MDFENESEKLCSEAVTTARSGFEEGEEQLKKIKELSMETDGH